MKETIDNIRQSLNAYYPESEISGFLRIIIEHITEKSYATAIMEQKQLSPTQVEDIQHIIDRLKQNEPIQHIIEETGFYGIPLFVSKDTLIPRPETEELVELIINDNNKKSPSILDIGTGSGCIAIALSSRLRTSNISAWDFSQEALSIASKNALRNNVNIDFRKVNVLDPYPTDRQFDVIVSNPPYILDSEKKYMDKNVLDYEPHSALFVPDDKALLFYERIADIAKELLNDKGKLYFEINQAKGKETIAMLDGKGYRNTILFKDISGKDRMIRTELAHR